MNQGYLQSLFLAGRLAKLKIMRKLVVPMSIFIRKLYCMDNGHFEKLFIGNCKIENYFDYFAPSRREEEAYFKREFRQVHGDKRWK